MVELLAVGGGALSKLIFLFKQVIDLLLDLFP